MRIVMMGTGTFAEPTFEAVLAAFPGAVVGLVTQPDRDGGNKRGSTRQTGKGMAAIARDAGVPVAQPESINTLDGLAQLQTFRPDLLVAAAYGQILSNEVIATPTMGAINVHASLLPKYRGASPVAHAILNGETLTGVTIIRITLGLDAGDMLAQEAVDILPNETTGELEARLAPVGARLAVDVIGRMQAGPVSGEKQDPSQVTKAPKLKKEHGLIDWSKPAAAIVNHVRAMQPWPTAYTFFHRPGKEPMRVIVSRGAVSERANWRKNEPYEGRVLASFLMPAPGGGYSHWPIEDRLVVTAGWIEGRTPTAVEIVELQPAGKKRMTAGEFLRGYPIQEGYRFGPERLA